MLTIRKKHFEAFRSEAMIDFEDRMIDHLRRFSPRHFKLLDAEQVRGVIQEGVARAAAHGLTSERSVRYYVDVMFMVGSGFDADPLLPWAAAILTEKAPEAVRIDRLEAAAWAHVERVLDDYRGLDGTTDQGRFIAELRRLRGESDVPLTTDTIPGFRERTAARLTELFARKSEHAGAGGVGALIDHGIACAATYGVVTERGASVFIAMMFVLGAGFTEDPLLPWVPVILTDEALDGPATRVDRLYAGAVACLGQWWDRS